jgi:hypothetical protein
MIQLKDVIHYYIGCKVRVDNEDTATFMGGTLVPNSLGQIYWHLQTGEMKDAEGDDFSMPYNDDPEVGELRIKPILRRLEDITDKEIKELIGWDNLNEKYANVSYERGNFGIMINYSIDAGEEGIHPQSHKITFHAFSPKEWLYLLKNGFDLFGLIKSGQAVDAKTWNQNKIEQ